MLGLEPADVELREKEKSKKFVAMGKITRDFIEDAEPVLKVLEEDICKLFSCKCCSKNSVIGDDEDDYMNR